MKLITFKYMVYFIIKILVPFLAILVLLILRCKNLYDKLQKRIPFCCVPDNSRNCFHIQLINKSVNNNEYVRLIGLYDSINGVMLPNQKFHDSIFHICYLYIKYTIKSFFGYNGPYTCKYYEYKIPVSSPIERKLYIRIDRNKDYIFNVSWDDIINGINHNKFTKKKIKKIFKQNSKIVQKKQGDSYKVDLTESQRIKDNDFSKINLYLYLFCRREQSIFAGHYVIVIPFGSKAYRYIQSNILN